MLVLIWRELELGIEDEKGVVVVVIVVVVVVVVKEAVNGALIFSDVVVLTFR